MAFWNDFKKGVAKFFGTAAQTVVGNAAMGVLLRRLEDETGKLDDKIDGISRLDSRSKADLKAVVATMRAGIQELLEIDAAGGKTES